ncbi:MAG: YqgE/AlgH family protein [Hahellaceae bacterium]|jgi:putative transcriptional regulator|nr:YqgE/AlgH family protein [Hahellaceae bacterium]MCP5210193.1 YqgE/AlgH family protein [Hahellaceae bacterium]
MDNKATYLKHQLLIAMPHMADPNFAGTVTYICEHNEHGAMGIIINRPTELTLGDVFEQMNLGPSHRDELVYAGGPVQIERGFVIHRPKGDWQATLPIEEDICLTSSRDILTAYANNEGPVEAIIALGYAGWGAGQLEQELLGNSWLNCPADAHILFHVHYRERLAAAAAKIGVDLSLLSNQVGHA